MMQAYNVYIVDCSYISAPVCLMRCKCRRYSNGPTIAAVVELKSVLTTSKVIRHRMRSAVDQEL